MKKEEIINILETQYSKLGRISTELTRRIFIDEDIDTYLGGSSTRKQVFLKIRTPLDIDLTLYYRNYKNLSFSQGLSTEFLYIYLHEMKYLDIFALMIQEIFDTLDDRKLNTEVEKFKYIVELINKWSDFFDENNSLSRRLIIGLITELMIVEELLKHIPESEIIDAWTGPSHAAKDFTFGNVSFEIKYISADKIKISSKYQLDHAENETLYLQTFENDPNAPVVSLEIIIQRLLNKIVLEENSKKMKAKIREYGYIQELHSDKEGNYKYNIAKSVLYRVTDDFPRITEGNIDSRVRNVRYSLNTHDIAKYTDKNDDFLFIITSAKK